MSAMNTQVSTAKNNQAHKGMGLIARLRKSMDRSASQNDRYAYAHNQTRDALVRSGLLGLYS